MQRARRSVGRTGFGRFTRSSNTTWSDTLLRTSCVARICSEKARPKSRAARLTIDAAATGRGCSQTARKTERGRIRQGKHPLGGGNPSPFTKHDPDASFLFEPSVTESGSSETNLGGTGSYPYCSYR